VTSRPVTLVVLAWNRWELTKLCLDSLRSTDLSGAEVIVVDNGSTDETPSAIRDYGWVRVIRNATNLGYVGGNNAGIHAADPASDVVLLNNDLVFCQRDWLQRLRVCAHSADDVGVVGCRQVLPDCRLLHAGTFILPDTVWGQQIGALEKDVGQYTATRDVQGVVFACAYLRREALAAVGTLSEDFESYFEDTDYCLRARHAGFRVLYCGDVTIVHDEHGSTADREFERMKKFRRSREIFRRKWKRELDRLYSRAVVWQSIMNFPTGYAMSSREIVRALDRQGVRVAYRYVYGPGTPFPVAEPDSNGDYLLDVVRRRPVAQRPPLSVVYGQGDVFDRNIGRRKVGFTMLEVDGFPREWVRQAGRMDEVWVPSEFNRRGFLESGLKRPVEVVPLGIDPDHFHPGVRGFPNPAGEFVFLSNFEWGERKDPATLLQAFSREFSAGERVRLVCKITNRDPSVRVIDEIRRLNLLETGGRISYIFNREFPYSELGALYRSADCYVSAGRGEGWDMPLMEAMACGLPSIVTDWGAHLEFAHPGNAYLLRVRKLVPAVAKCPYYEGFSWADPDPEHLRHLLRNAYENRDEAKRIGAVAAREMASRWSWHLTADRIVQRLEELDP
jgi:GT2 family glycosyltransferase